MSQQKITMEELILRVMYDGRKDQIFEEDELYEKCIKYAEEHNLYVLLREEMN